VIGAMERASKPPPNVDSAAVVLRAALGMPPGAVAGLFAVGRAAGWVAHALEQVATGHLLRPRARYRGPLPVGSSEGPPPASEARSEAASAAKRRAQ